MTSHSPDLKRATAENDGRTPHIYRVWFYGLNGVYQDKVEVLKQQLTN